MSLLNTPIKLKNIQFSNRLVMPPMATGKSYDDGTISEEICSYYDEKSKGGYIGLIITEHSFISQEGKASFGQVSISKDEDIEGLSKLVDIIHKNGSCVFAQINHAGGVTSKEITGYDTLSASSILLAKSKDRKNLPKTMTQDDIDKVIEDFVNASIRAKKAGFDGVEIHSAHGYLLNQFFSPLSNKRDDSYGGKSVLDRIKIHLEIIHRMRMAVGDDFPLAIRLGACDYTECGTTIDDSVSACIEFEKAGIDLIDISGGFSGYTNPNDTQQGYFSEITQAIKKVVNIPVILTGGITNPNVAEKLLVEKKADMIGVGRAILKDSNWAKNCITSLK